VIDEHERLREALAAEALGALDAAEHARLVEHLRTCADCRRLLAEYRDAAGLLPYELLLEAPPAGAWAAVRARLHAAEPVGRGRSSRLRGWLVGAVRAHPRRLLLAPLAAALVLVVIVFANRQSASNKPRVALAPTAAATIAATATRNAVTAGTPAAAAAAATSVQPAASAAATAPLPAATRAARASATPTPTPHAGLPLFVPHPAGGAAGTDPVSLDQVPLLRLGAAGLVLLAVGWTIARGARRGAARRSGARYRARR